MRKKIPLFLFKDHATFFTIFTTVQELQFSFRLGFQSMPVEQLKRNITFCITVYIT